MHRDLQPANIMLTREGRVKVLDFGLAKLALDEPVGADEADETQLATRAPTLTGEGIVMGTAPYMSPEQLQGKAIDPRSDIFSLGVVLYEMVTGSRPFQGDSGIALASAILKDSPTTVTEAKAEIPRHLGRIVHRCLEKDPRSRYQSALDVFNELKGLRDEVKSGEVTSIGSAAIPTTTPGVPSGATAAAPATAVSGSGAVVTDASAPAVVTSSRRPLWFALGAVSLVLAALFGWYLTRRSGEGPPVTEETAKATGDRASGESGASTDGRQMIVGLPFENLGPAEDEYFA
ncbi:MAG: serine/threonine-protein kinase, partial [Acidobacteriota bacterium]